MISLRFVLLAAVFSSTALASVTPQRYYRQRRQVAPEGFTAIDRPPEDEPIVLRIALAQRDYTSLEKALYAASTPGSEKYGQYLTKDQVNAHVAPSDDTVEAVSSWLSSHGLSSSSVTPSGDWITVNTTVSQASQLLQADFITYEHPELAATLTRTLSYSVPSEVKEHISAIHPTTAFPLVDSRPKRTMQEVLESNQPVDVDAGVSEDNHGSGEIPESCFYDRNDPSNDPELFWKPWGAPCTHDLYEIPYRNLTEPVEGAGLWFSGFYHEFANTRRTTTYLQQWRPDLLPDRAQYDVLSITGGMNNQLPAGAGIFATSQLWWAASLPVNTPITFMSVGTERSNDFMDWFLDQADYLLNMDDPPSVLLHHMTVLETEVDPEFAQLLCNKYAQLSARGVSLIFPVSLGGVGGPYATPDDSTCSSFQLSFPASCPFVTSIGGTQMAFDGRSETPPSGWAANNGGFSSLFQRPAYQESAAAGYLEKLGDKHSGYFDPAGRGVPDVALQEWVSDTVSAIGAPGMSAGLFGSMIAMLNEELVQAGKPRLGFLNPLLYAKGGGVFRDFAAGNNPGCNTDGFNATTGWDPVTGLGAPIYPRLRAAVGL